MSDQPVAETSDNTQHSQQISMASVGFEPMVSAGKRPQTYALDRAATGIGSLSYQDSLLKNKRICNTIRPVATHGAEYWTLKKDIAKWVAAF